jgi:hypothetical protein
MVTEEVNDQAAQAGRVLGTDDHVQGLCRFVAVRALPAWSGGPGWRWRRNPGRFGKRKRYTCPRPRLAVRRGTSRWPGSPQSRGHPPCRCRRPPVLRDAGESCHLPPGMPARARTTDGSARGFPGPKNNNPTTRPRRGGWGGQSVQSACGTRGEGRVGERSQFHSAFTQVACHAPG